MRRNAWRFAIPFSLAIILTFISISQLNAARIIQSSSTDRAITAALWTESFETDGEGTRYNSSNSFNDSNHDHFQTHRRIGCKQYFRCLFKH